MNFSSFNSDMTKFFYPIFLVFSLLIYCSLFSQVNQQFNQDTKKFRDKSLDSKFNYLLDGKFIKETSPTRNIKYNSFSKPYYNNVSFRFNGIQNFSYIFKLDFFKDQDSEIILNDSTKRFINNQPKYDNNISDCIYIEPIKHYAININSPISKPLFILDKVPSLMSRNFIFANSMRFYIDTSYISIGKNQIDLNLDSNFILNESNFLEPFYFRKFEVTNEEYREFVHWVKDSIFRTALFESGFKEYGYYETTKQGDSILILNWKTSINFDNDEIKEELNQFYLPNYERFYDNKTIDTRKLFYSFQTNNKNQINIYPDTLTWVKNFIYSFNEPLANLYFWHPAYNDYPVVGVSFWQAQAFLDWKTKQHQKSLNKVGSNLVVSYQLPNDFQWDIVSTAEMDNENKISLFTTNYESFSDQNWITDLQLKQNLTEITDSIDSSGKKYFKDTFDYLHKYLKTGEKFFNNMIIDGTLTTFKSDLSSLKKKERKNPLIAINIDKTGISHLGSNVSEWIDNDYATQWKPLFDLRQKQLQSNDGEEFKIISNIEKYYDQKNNPEGKLIRGGNWYDERFSNLLGKNTKGMNAKTFAHPDSSFSTVGFRYIVKFQIKESISPE